MSSPSSFHSRVSYAIPQEGSFCATVLAEDEDDEDHCFENDFQDSKEARMDLFVRQATLGPGPFVQIIESIEECAPSCAVGGMCHEHTFYLVRVRKSREEAEVEISNPVYETRLDRSAGGRLGLKLEVHLSSQSLFIKEILGGLAFVWNSKHPDLSMRPGDRIIRVNDIEGNAQLMNAECKKNQVLSLGVYKSTAVPVTPGLKATCLEAFDNLEPGLRGTVTRVDEEGDALIRIPGIGNQWVCRTDYDKFKFEDGDCFYFKRYCDFRELWTKLRSHIDAGTIKVVKKLPEMPVDSNSGFRRRSFQQEEDEAVRARQAALDATTFMKSRTEALQKYISCIFSQLKRVDSEPAVAQFFGTEAIPEVDPVIKENLKHRLEFYVDQYRSAQFFRQAPRFARLVSP